MNSKNAVTLIGYVGRDLKSTTHDGLSRVALRMAMHKSINQTTWHNVIAWEQVADFANRNFVKGSKIMVERAIVYESYTGKDGNKKFGAHIKAISLTNLDR